MIFIANFDVESFSKLDTETVAGLCSALKNNKGSRVRVFDHKDFMPARFPPLCTGDSRASS